MGTMKEHLAGFHKIAMGRCDTVDKCLGKIIGMAKSAKADLKPNDDDGLCGNLEKIRQAFADGAKYHKTAMAECEKITDVEFSKAASPEFEKRLAHLENTLVPTKVSAVTPDRPGRPVPRYGQQPIERPNVPIQFEKLVVIEE
jgi:hypothetical protein